LDNFGNLPESGQLVPGITAEKVTVTRYIYDDDDEAVAEALTNSEKTPKRGSKKKKG
jgi:hypothetical protein